MDSDALGSASELHAPDLTQPRVTSKPIDIQPPTTALGIAAASLAANARSFMPDPTLNSTTVRKNELINQTRSSPKVVDNFASESDRTKSAALITENTGENWNHFANGSPASSSSHISDMSANELYAYSQHALRQADEEDEWQAVRSDIKKLDHNEAVSNASEPNETENGLDNESSTLCLFCEQTFPTPELTVNHCQQMHNVDLVACCRSLDELQYIRLINYIRKEQVSPDLLIDGKICMPKTAWNQDVYLIPVIADDPILTMLIVGKRDEDGNASSSSYDKNAEIQHDAVNRSSNPAFHILGDDNSDGLPPLLTLSPNVEKLQSQALDAFENGGVIHSNDFNADDNLLNPESTDLKRLSDGARSHDAGYFATYSHFGIHEEMLKDEIRTRGYLNVIENLRESHIKGRTVLDVGCGTCILSAFAVRAGGARKVYAVDQADIVNDAFDILNENGGDLAVAGNGGDRIEIIRSMIEKVRLSTNHVDVIISEWMGYFLLFESMLESVLHARDKFMQKNTNTAVGLMIPNRATIHMSLVSDEERYAEAIDYWDDVYGLKMSRIKRLRLKTPEVNVVPESTCLGPSGNNVGVLLKQFDLMTMRPDETEFESYIKLPIGEELPKLPETPTTADETPPENPYVVITALAGWFDVSVVLPSDASTHEQSSTSAPQQVLEMFTTSPFAPETHWKQTIFYLPEKLSLPRGSILTARVVVNKHPKDTRALLINITLWLDDKLETECSHPLNAAEMSVDHQKYLTKKPLLTSTYEML